MSRPLIAGDLQLAGQIKYGLVDQPAAARFRTGQDAEPAEDECQQAGENQKQVLEDSPHGVLPEGGRRSGPMMKWIRTRTMLVERVGEIEAHRANRRTIVNADADAGLGSDRGRGVAGIDKCGRPKLAVSR